jgi:serine/threonine protein kinase
MNVTGFKILRTIGRGGMATVYLAIQESLERKVVLKVMNTAQSESKDFISRFINEGRIVAGLRHPHIITIHDIGQADGLVYIAMEYVEGGDLKSRIGEPHPPEEVLHIMRGVAEALSFAHEKGVIHRDVKPANILFRTDGTVLLSDFGIAKQIASDSELTSTGTILGSPFYMSPEQSEGVKVDGRTDLYSLGVILYEMLTGERPYLGDSAIKVIMQHIQSPLPTLPDALSGYQGLLNRLMAKNRDERVPDAGALCREIDALLSQGATGGTEVGAQSGAPDSSAGSRSRPPSSGKRRLGLAAAAVGLVLAGVLGSYVYTETVRPAGVVFARPSPGASAHDASAVDIHASSGVPAAGIAPTPAIGGVQRKDVAKALEWLAFNSLKEDRLTQPPADNAYYYYSRLIALDPANEAARSGFSEIAERFVVLAEQEFSRKNFGKAHAYIALGLQVEPDNGGLTALRSFIENREKSFLDTILELVRGG